MLLENDKKIGDLSMIVREEKQARKLVEAKVAQLNEELQDLKSTNEAMEKVDMNIILDGSWENHIGQKLKIQLIAS